MIIQSEYKSVIAVSMLHEIVMMDTIVTEQKYDVGGELRRSTVEGLKETERKEGSQHGQDMLNGTERIGRQ